MTIAAISLYAAALVAANLLVATFGPGIAPLLAFFLIGLDLSLRDWLHVRLKWWQMGGLIAATGLVTFALNPAAGQIAVASACAFAAAALVDWSVFAGLRGQWLTRANLSNVAGAAVDSVVFSALAPWPFDVVVVAMMFFAKVAGGSVWAWVLSQKAAKATA